MTERRPSTESPITAERWARVSPLIDAALALAPHERAAYIGRVTTGDPALRADLERLLAHAEGGDSLINRGAIERFAMLISEPAPGLSGVLADRFVVEREIGQGGMATVYLAHDRKHDRPVAVKVLRTELASTIGPERFLREIRTAARLQHPHILPLHDSGERDGLLYYVMPYVEGESLRQRLVREQQLSIDDALRITREVADALDHAHRHDVVHRDIKPENILLSGGHALVMDFGIARAVSASGSDTLTAGLALGTPTYMAPEQATAERSIDGRADIYALGCVLYEMLTGRPPFTGETLRDVLARHAIAPVPSPRALRPDVPGFVEDAVVRALAKTPDGRFATAAAFSAACDPTRAATPAGRSIRRRVLLVAGGAALVITGLQLLRNRQPSAPRLAVADAAAPTIAVLPLRNIGGDPSNEAISDGISEEIAASIRRIPGLIVRSPRSAFSFKNKSETIQQIATALDVRYLVDGSLERGGDQLRVRVQLLSATNDSTVWADEYNRPFRDLFAVEDEIARAIAGELRLRLPTAPGSDIAERPTRSSEAHDLYLQGRYFFERRDSASLRKAREYFASAIRSDSNYALAYAGLSDANSHSSVFGYTRPEESMPTAKEYLRRAFQLDSTLVQVQSSLGFIGIFYDWDLRTAGDRFARAVALDAGYPSAHLWRAWYYMAADSVDASIREARQAVALEPFLPLTNTRLITLLYYAGRFEEALQQAQKTFELDSTFFQIRTERARVLAQLGRCEEAMAELSRSQAQGAAQLQGTRGWALAKCGRRADALAELNRLHSASRAGTYISHYALAVIQAGLGNHDEVFAELEKALEERAWPMFMLKRELAFENVRRDPRFAELVRRVGLPRADG